MTYNVLEAVIRSGAQLPSPGVYLPALQKLAANDRANYSDFGEVVKNDPAIVGMIMRIANSAVFGARRKTETLESAIAMIGISKLMAIAAVVALDGCISLLEPELRKSVEEIFEKSKNAAAFSFAIANEKCRHLADAAYLAALMQDAGTIILAQREDVVRFEHNSNDAHTSLGAMLMRNFKMPGIVSDAIAVHHWPTQAKRAGGNIYMLACLLGAGRCLIDSAEWPLWAGDIYDALGIDDKAIGDIHTTLLTAE